MRPATNTVGSRANSVAVVGVWQPRNYVAPQPMRTMPALGANQVSLAEDACRCRFAPAAAVSVELEEVAQSSALQLESQTGTVEAAQELSVREAESAVEFEQVGWLRARAYYEVCTHRFVRGHASEYHCLAFFRELGRPTLYAAIRFSSATVRRNVPAGAGVDYQLTVSDVAG